MSQEIRPDPKALLDVWRDDGDIKSIAEVRQAVIKAALERYPDAVTEAARRLNIGRSTLYRTRRELSTKRTSSTENE